jgi:hypothetical protein
MKSKETKMMSWRLKLKLVAVVFLGAAALLLTTAQPASASTVCQTRRCLSGATILGCCNSMTAYGYDSRGPCSIHVGFACWKRGG